VNPLLRSYGPWGSSERVSYPFGTLTGWLLLNRAQLGSFATSVAKVEAHRIVARLSPPAPSQEAERVLRRVFDAFGRELYREQHESQPTKQVKKELKALQKVLSSLSPRAANVLSAELEEGPFLAHPYHQAQLVISPCSPGVPWTRLSGAVVLRMVRLATERVLSNTPQLRPGHPGNVSKATRRAIHVLCRVYCHWHAEPYPKWDFFAEEVRNSAALEFALSCLRDWDTLNIDNLEPKDVVRSLHNYSGQNRT
jgi:hypothetical protein